MSRGMRRGWQVATAAILLLCLFMMWQSWQLRLVDRLGPGPGFFPFWLGAIGAALAALIFGQTTRLAGETGEAVFPRERLSQLRMAAIVGITALAAALMLLLGFRLTMLLFAGGLTVALGGRTWWAIALFAAAAGLGVFYVFNNCLDVILPTGLLEQITGLQWTRCSI